MFKCLQEYGGFREFERMGFSMKKTLTLVVDCANCANKVENGVRGIPGIAEATVNFMAQKLIVKCDDGTDFNALFKQIEKVVTAVDDDAEVYMK